MGSILVAYKDSKLPQNFFRVPVRVFRYLGIELMCDEESPMYRIYSAIILLMVVYLLTIMQCLEVYCQWGDMDRIANVAPYFFTYTSGMVKVTLIYINRKKIGNIIKMLHRSPFYPNVQRGGPEEESCIRGVVKTTEMQMAVYCVIVFMTIVSGGLASLESRLFKSKDEWRFPFNAITIVDTTDSPMFEIWSIWQFLFVFLYATMIVFSYCLNSTIFAHLSIQLKLLQNAFRTLNGRAKAITKHSDQPQSYNYFVKKLLEKYINHHLKVLDLANQMEELCNKMVLVVYVSSVIMLCFNLYQATWYRIGSLSWVQYCTYSLIIICQVGMYGYWGDEVTSQACEVGVAVAEVDWVDTPPPIARALIMIIARSRRPLHLTAGKFIPLSLASVMSIVKGSISYFMVLIRTKEAKLTE